jgi:hypothetical protein
LYNATNFNNTNLQTSTEQDASFNILAYKIGDKIHLKHFQKPVRVGFVQKSTGKYTYDAEKSKKDSVARSRKMIRSKLGAQINKHGYNKARFLTLTTGYPYENWEELKTILDQWLRIIRKETDIDLKVIAVPEIQDTRLEKRGETAWHIHLVTFYTYIDINYLNDTWCSLIKDNPYSPKKGNVQLSKKQPQNPMHVINYITSYMSKDFNDRGKYAHRYYCSQGMEENKEWKYYSNELHGIQYLSRFCGKFGTQPITAKRYNTQYNGELWSFIIPATPEIEAFLDRKDPPPDNLLLHSK